MDTHGNLVETLPPGWKWDALFAPPGTVEPQWRAWLAAAQRAEEEALLSYWAKRPAR
jgi:hypothetical protein